MITIGQGLQNSLIVLEFLRNDEELNQMCDIHVGTFTNCREEGLTFVLVSMKEDGEYIPCVEGMTFTWCVYEHRNSDSIIINGKEGFVSMNGDLPYMADDKYKYLAEFRYNEHYKAAEKLASFITERAEIAIAKYKAREQNVTTTNK